MVYGIPHLVKTFSLTASHMSTPLSVNLSHHFSSIEDPRVDSTKCHKLPDIIGLSICAVICGAEGWEGIEEYGIVFVFHHNGCANVNDDAGGRAFCQARSGQAIENYCGQRKLDNL
jgi:hypothetical protein